MTIPISVNEKLVELIAEYGVVEISKAWSPEDENDEFYIIGRTEHEDFEPFVGGNSTDRQDGDEFYTPVEAINAAYRALATPTTEGGER